MPLDPIGQAHALQSTTYTLHGDHATKLLHYTTYTTTIH